MRIRVIGAGVMGRGITQWAATAGHTVELADADSAAVDSAVVAITQVLERLVDKGRLSQAAATLVADRILKVAHPTQASDELDLVIEAAKEELAVKRTIFGELERVVPMHTIFATNTSSLSITGIGASLADPGRLAGLHFFNPVPLMKIVEVVPGTATRAEVIGTLVELVAQSGHRPVRVTDSPGFLVNHVGRGLVTEALALLEESVAAPADIDAIARDVLGLRMGPFELMDLTGLDVSAAVMESVWTGFKYDDRLRPSYLSANRVSSGLFGRKSGQGFYVYGDQPVAPTPHVPAGGAYDRPVWVSGDGPQAEQLRAYLVSSGAVVDGVSAPAPGSLVLVPTWGTTVSATVAFANLPAATTVGIDPLSLNSARVVLAMTPATEPASVRDAAALFGDRAVSVTRDTAGSVAQRILAAIVGVGCSVAEKGLATPADIDFAVTAGLGYPHGPLSWGDVIGAQSVLALQLALHATTGDQRYRPTRWLAERAQLGLHLSTLGYQPTDC